VDQPRRIGERVLLGVLVDEEVERIDRRHIRDQVDGDRELRGRLREHEPRLVVAGRVLDPVDEVLLGGDPQAVGQDRRAAVRRRPQPDHLRAEQYRAVVPIDRPMLDGDTNAHDGLP
jgi:hypothetical protein